MAWGRDKIIIKKQPQRNHFEDNKEKLPEHW